MIKQIVKPPGPISNALGQSLSSILSELSIEIGKDLADGYRNWRNRNFSRVVQKAEALHSGSPLILDADHQVPLGLAYLLVDSASNEEDDKVQEMWARLIIAARSGRISADYKPYTEAVKSFTALMAIVFEAICNQTAPDTNFPEYIGVAPDRSEGSKLLTRYKDEEIFAALAALKRLGVVENIDRRFDKNRLHIPEVLEEAQKKGLLAISDAVDYLNMATELPLRASIDRVQAGDVTVVLLSVWITDFGACLADVLGFSRTQ